ncbi:MAG: transporter substrate-binding domain-containing protein [Clostridia bacterium]|nr:transporter substrate-binding domain-containing protein [Clostridia bacterium]
MKKLLSIALVMLFVLAGCACAEGFTFKMGIDAEYPPYSYLDDNGEYAGFDVEMCQKVCEILGWNLEIVPINWDTKDIQLDAEEIDCIWSGLTVYANGITEDRFTISTPYSDNSQMILTKKGTGIESFDDLAGKTVGVQMGTSAEAALTGDGEAAALGATFGTLQPYENYNIAFTDLQAGAIDAIAVDAPVANDKINKYGDDYYCLDESFASEKYGICFRKADTELCAQVEGAYMQLVEDGTYLALGEKYQLDTSFLVLAAK